MVKYFNKHNLKEKFSRKEFIKRGGILALGLGAGNTLLRILEDIAFAKNTIPFLHEAMYYEKLDAKTLRCQLCPNRCMLSNGVRGFCRAREPKDGKLYSLVYGLACAVHIDPIEKKPLFHFLPGTKIFSIATAGCNFRCLYCQNWSISQFPPEETENTKLSPRDVVEQTIKNNCPSIAYTYSEPSIFYEYMLDTAKLAKTYGIKSMYHSNGSLNPEPVLELAKYLDAADIDLKGFTQDFYSKTCNGYLDTVLNTLRILNKNNVWLEITNLVVPTLNDDPAKIKEMCIWIKENLADFIPVHFSRFWPQYKLRNLTPTPVETLERARDIAMSVGLKFVYIGNVPGHNGENTYCPKCKKVLIRRIGYTILENNISSEGLCKICSEKIPGIWS